MPKFVVGTSKDDSISIRLCEAVGIDPTTVTRIVIDLRAGSPARVYFDTYGDSDHLDELAAGLVAELHTPE